MAHTEISEVAFRHTISDEVLAAEGLAPFEVSSQHEDIGLAWAVSSTGTVYEAADLGPDNPYTGVTFDRGVVDESARIIRDITALRLDKHPEKVSRGDIERHGPSMLYNGERPGMPGGKFPGQVPDFENYVESDGFLVPRQNIIIGDIEAPNTPAQVKQLGELLQGRDELKHFAAVCGIGHSVRVGRYIQHAREVLGLIPKDTKVTPAFVRQADRDQAIAALETDKAVQYLSLGHLTVESAFFTDNQQS